MASANRRRVWIGSGARMDKCGVECEVAWLSIRVGSLPSVGSALPSARDLALGNAECQIGGHLAKLGFAECQELGKQIFANSILTCKTQKNKIQIKNKHYFMHNNFKLKLR